MTAEIRTDIVGKAASTDIYHYLDGEREQSLCGHLNNNGFFGPGIAVILSETDAQQQDFRLCDLCEERRRSY